MTTAAQTIIDPGTPAEGTDDTTKTVAAEATTTESSTPANDPAGTIADGKDDVDTKAPSDWPEDWRQRVASQIGKDFGGDEKVLKLLERRSSPVELAKWALNADKKIAAGEFKRALPAKPTDEELATWRQENAVPEAWDKYSKDLGDGTVFSEADNAIIDDFLQQAHKANMPQPFVKETLAFYRDLQEKAVVEQLESDKAFHRDSLLELGQEFGAEFKSNVNAISQLFDNAPDGLYNQLMTARTPDGKLVGDHPDVIRWLVGVAKEVNPLATLGGTSTNAEGLADEMAGFQKRMRDDPEGWHKDQKAQARLRELIERQDKMKNR